ncbi:MAG: hypothetical protein U5L74_06550 [Ideonella sp.]|nr:hypothetical protein [Ideonella sp.]
MRYGFFAPSGRAALGRLQRSGFDLVQMADPCLRHRDANVVQHKGPGGRHVLNGRGEQKPIGELGHLAGALARLVQFGQGGGKHVDVDHPPPQAVELDRVADLVGLHHRRVKIAVHAHHQLFADDQQSAGHGGQ